MLNVRQKLATVTFAVVIAVAVIPSVASAVSFELTSTACSGGHNFALCYQGKNPKSENGVWELKGEQLATIDGETLEFKNISVQFACAEVSGEVIILQNEPLGLGAVTTLDGLKKIFSPCTIKGPAEVAERCSIPTELRTLELKGELLSNTELIFKPVSGEVFAEVTIENAPGKTCPSSIKGTHNITGTEQFEVIEPEVAAKGKKIKAGKKSKLSFLGGPLELIEEPTVLPAEITVPIFFSSVA